MFQEGKAILILNFIYDSTLYNIELSMFGGNLLAEPVAMGCSVRLGLVLGPMTQSLEEVAGLQVGLPACCLHYLLSQGPVFVGRPKH